MAIKAVTRPEVLTSEPSSVPDRDQTAFVARLKGDSVLVCSGELDPATNPALRRSLGRLLRLAPDRVVVDLSRVSFFDAGAIGEFVRARETSRAAGGDLVVRAPSPFGRRVLGIVGLTNLLAEEPRRHTAPRNATAAVGAHAAELVSAWEAACATSRYGAAPLAFDPTAVLAAITALIDDPSSINPSAADLSLVVARREETSAASAVMQLWALRDVLHAWIETNRGPTLGSESEERRRVDLESALAGMAASALAGRFSAGNRSSVVIDEAKGLIAEHFDIGIDEASIMLRAFSTAQHQPMLAAAVALMNRSIDVARLAPHRSGQPDAPVGDTEPGAVVSAPSGES